MPYYLYKLSIKGCKKYYIGVTSNPKERKDHHCRMISALVKFFKLKNISVSSYQFLKCHYDLGCVLCDALPLAPTDSEIKSRIIFKILDERKYIEDILKLERETVMKARNGMISNIVHR
jgi:hypothetical protein